MIVNGNTQAERLSFSNKQISYNTRNIHYFLSFQQP
jgi:hypothetical protein